MRSTPAGGGIPLALGRPTPEEHLDAAVGVMTGIILHTDDAEAAHADLRARGVDVDDLTRVPGAPALFSLRDVDANTLVVAQTDPEA